MIPARSREMRRTNSSSLAAGATSPPARAAIARSICSCKSPNACSHRLVAKITATASSTHRRSTRGIMEQQFWKATEATEKSSSVSRFYQQQPLASMTSNAAHRVIALLIMGDAGWDQRRFAAPAHHICLAAFRWWAGARSELVPPYVETVCNCYRAAQAEL